MIPSSENSEDSTHKLLELINEISKIAAYKINIHKSFAFLYTNNGISERECKKKKKSTFQNHTTQNKILRNKPDQGGDRLIY